MIPEKEKMKFCKKCHKRVIKMVSDVEEIKNRCMCTEKIELKSNSEIFGLISGAMSHGRTGLKRALVKEINRTTLGN